MKATDIRGQIKPDTIFEDLARNLDPYKKRKVGSLAFLVDSDPNEKVKILIKYPGRKVRQRTGRIQWANLYDFLVAPIHNGKEIDTRLLRWSYLREDFYEHKLHNSDFWKLLEELYATNKVNYEKIPMLSGMDPTMFLLLIKWMWIQEDLNYKYSSRDIPNCPTPYRNETKNGSVTKGAGRGKFYASLLLVKYHGFTPHEVGRIIP